jgi:hypothetical protein
MVEGKVNIHHFLLVVNIYKKKRNAYNYRIYKWVNKTAKPTPLNLFCGG